MNRLKTYIISILLLLTWATDSWGCGIWECPPSEYLLYRVADPSMKGKGRPQIEQLAESDDPDVKRYLQLARSCEKIRSLYDSKWYYPTKEEDVVVSSLEDILNESLAYKGDKLKDRYALQAARAMFTLGKFSQMCSWWEDIKDELKDDIIKRAIEGYVAGALFRTGEQAKALEYYTEIGDIASIIYCLKKMDNYAGNSSLLEYAAVHCPDNPAILEILQEYIANLEVYGDFSERNGLTDECYEMCMKAVKHSKKPAPWLYTAAFLKNQMGEPYVASNILARAENCDASIFLQESMKVLRILIDAQISTYNKAYEEKLLKDLSWLDEKICVNITDKVREETADLSRLKFGYSYYYWNDMMRKVVLGTVVPRMFEAGKAPLALLLANYADYRLLMLVGNVAVREKWDEPVRYVSLADYRRNSCFNWYDFSNHYFRILDNTTTSNIVAYERSLKNPVGSLETFLHKRSYRNDDYLNDLIGTKYLRELDYIKAVAYLEKVSKDYQAYLNTSPYMDTNPFSSNPEQYTSGTYKLDFARKMVDYDSLIDICKDQDIVGEAVIMKGLGIRSSFTNCWALTHYGKSEYNPWYEDKNTVDILHRANTIIREGLGIIRDPELAARYYREFHMWKTAAEKFPETKVGREILSSCDNIVDYEYKYPQIRDTGYHQNMYCW